MSELSPIERFIKSPSELPEKYLDFGNTSKPRKPISGGATSKHVTPRVDGVETIFNEVLTEARLLCRSNSKVSDLGETYKAEITKLQQWGVAIGFQINGAESRDYDLALEEPGILLQVKQILNSIKQAIIALGADSSSQTNVREQVDHGSQSKQVFGWQRFKSYFRWRSLEQLHVPFSLRSQRKQKNEERITQIKILKDSVQRLYDLHPPHELLE